MHLADNEEFLLYRNAGLVAIPTYSTYIHVFCNMMRPQNFKGAMNRYYCVLSEALSKVTTTFLLDVLLLPPLSVEGHGHERATSSYLEPRLDVTS